MSRRDEYARQLRDDLQASFTRLEAENVALREIAEAVALSELTVDVDRLLYSCSFCHRTVPGPPTGEADLAEFDRLFPHQEGCPVTKARAVLAKQKEH